MADVIISSCGNWDVTWPFPQVFFGEYYTLGFAVVDMADDCATGFPAANDSLVLYELVNSSDIWTATACYDLGPVAYIDQINVMDFGQFYTVSVFGYNGSTPVITGCFRNPQTDPATFTDLPTSKIPKFITGCNFNGQAVIGGIISADPYWSSLGLSGVAWSAIGHIDFRAFEMSNVAGSRRMPWENQGKGIVYSIKKLTKGVVIFGDGGIAVLLPVSSPSITFGMKPFSGAGIRSGNHVAGDGEILCYIDCNYDLNLINGEFKNTRLGYREYMKELVTHASETFISYVPSRKSFYISNGIKCYVLTEFGLYSTDQRPTSVGDYKGTLCGFWVDGADPEIRLSTDRLDFGSQGLKTIEGVEYGIHYQATDAGLSAEIDFLYNYNDTSFRSSGWKALSPLGQITDRITAREFNIKLKGTTYKNATFNLDSILVKVKFPDKRSIRGLMR